MLLQIPTLLGASSLLQPPAPFHAPTPSMGPPPLFILPQYFGLIHSFDLSYLFGLTLSEPLWSLASYKFGDSTLLGPLNSQWASRTPSFSHTSLASPPHWPPTYFSASTPRWPPKQPPIPHRPPTPFISLYTLSASHTFSASHSLVVNTPLGSYTFSISTLVRPSIPFVPQHSGFPVFSLNSCGSSCTFLASKLFLASHVQ